MRVTLSEPEHDFVNRLGLAAEAGGYARITGRIWGLLVIVGKPLAAEDIADTLQISRASVSTNLKTLQALELIEPNAKAGDRKTYYGMRDTPYASLIEGRIKQNAANISTVRKALKSIKRPAARSGLRDLLAFYEVMDKNYTATLAQMMKSKRT